MIKIPKRKCNRCGNEWSLRKDTEPIVCPKCKSPYWNKEKVVKTNE